MAETKRVGLKGPVFWVGWAHIDEHGTEVSSGSALCNPEDLPMEGMSFRDIAKVGATVPYTDYFHSGILCADHIRLCETFRKALHDAIFYSKSVHVVTDGSTECILETTRKGVGSGRSFAGIPLPPFRVHQLESIRLAAKLAANREDFPFEEESARLTANHPQYDALFSARKLMKYLEVIRGPHEVTAPENAKADTFHLVTVPEDLNITRWPTDTDDEMLKDAASYAYTKFQHYKGDIYTVLTLARTQDGDPVMVYQNQKSEVFTRGMKEFFETVEYKGEKVLRFTPVCDDPFDVIEEQAGV